MVSDLLIRNISRPLFIKPYQPKLINNLLKHLKKLLNLRRINKYWNIEINRVLHILKKSYYDDERCNIGRIIIEILNNNIVSYNIKVHINNDYYSPEMLNDELKYSKEDIFNGEDNICCLTCQKEIVDDFNFITYIEYYQWIKMINYKSPSIFINYNNVWWPWHKHKLFENILKIEMKELSELYSNLCLKKSSNKVDINLYNLVLRMKRIKLTVCKVCCLSCNMKYI